MVEWVAKEVDRGPTKGELKLVEWAAKEVDQIPTEDTTLE